MDQLSTSSSSYQARLREIINENIEDPVTTELMTRAVSIVPCGHVFNEDTVIELLARGMLCPTGQEKIERYVPNYPIRHLAENLGSITAEEGPTPEAEAHFKRGKQHADAGNNEQAVEAFLEALKLCPYYEKAQAYLEFCLKTSIGSSSLENIPSSLPSPKLEKNKEENTSSSKQDYIQLLLEYLDNLEIQKKSELVQFLEIQVESLMSEESIELSQKEKENYKWAKQLIVGNKVNSFVQKKLLQLSSLSASPCQSSSSNELTVASIPSSSSSGSYQQGFSPPIFCASLSDAMRRAARLNTQPQQPEKDFGKIDRTRDGDVGVDSSYSPCPSPSYKNTEQLESCIQKRL